MSQLHVGERCRRAPVRGFYENTVDLIGAKSCPRRNALSKMENSNLTCNCTQIDRHGCKLENGAVSSAVRIRSSVCTESNPEMLTSLAVPQGA